MQEGYLTLLEKPPGIVSLAKAKIDWSKTVCWGEGGYYSRIFFNVKGREPQGVVSPNNYEEVRAEIAQKLEAMCDEKGNPLGTKVFKPEDVYPEARGIPPELIMWCWMRIPAGSLLLRNMWEKKAGLRIWPTWSKPGTEEKPWNLSPGLQKQILSDR